MVYCFRAGLPRPQTKELMNPSNITQCTGNGGQLAVTVTKPGSPQSLYSGSYLSQRTPRCTAP